MNINKKKTPIYEAEVVLTNGNTLGIVGKHGEMSTYIYTAMSLEYDSCIEFKWKGKYVQIPKDNISYIIYNVKPEFDNECYSGMEEYDTKQNLSNIVTELLEMNRNIKGIEDSIVEGLTEVIRSLNDK